jgi:hypothetical protein
MSLYGCVTWDFNDRQVEVFYTAWRKAVRRVLGLHPMTHSRFLSTIMESAPIVIILKRRFLNFINRVLQHNNHLINLAGKLSLGGSISSVSNNLSIIADTLQVSRPRIQHKTGRDINIPRLDPEMTRRASAIRDFLTLRENNPGDARDITQIINLLGTMYTFIYIVIQSCDVIWLFLLRCTCTYLHGPHNL